MRRKAAVTDSSGRYTFPDVPEGRYTLSVWHEVLGKRERQVTVPGKGILNLNETF